MSGLNERRESDSDRLLEASIEEEDHAVEGTSGAEDITKILDEPLAHVLVLHVGTELHVVLIQVVVGRHQQLEVVGQQLYWLSRLAYVHTQDAMSQSAGNGRFIQYHLLTVHKAPNTPISIGHEKKGC